MSHFVYMLKSIEKKPVTYVGYTKDLKKRIILNSSLPKDLSELHIEIKKNE